MLRAIQRLLIDIQYKNYAFTRHSLLAIIFLGSTIKWKFLNCAWLFAISWTVWSMELSGIEYWRGSLSLLQEIFPTQGSNPGFPDCRWILFQVSHKGNPRILEWVAYPFSIRSSWSRNLTGVSHITGRFFTNWATSEDPLIKDSKIAASFSCIA